VRIEVDGDTVTRVRGDLDDPISKGFICPKGSALGKLHHDPDRLRRPLVRRDGRHVEVSWDEAFAEVERGLSSVTTAHGPESVGIYVGNPNAHNFQANLALRPLIKSLRTRQVFSASTVDQMPKQVACGYVFGHPFMIPVPDVDRSDHLLILGANPVESNGSLASAPDWPGKLAALTGRGGRLVVVDPRRTKTAALAQEHVRIRPGTDAVLLAAMAQELFAGGLVSVGRLAPDVEGLPELEAALAAYTPEWAEGPTAIPAETIRRMARELAAAERAVVYGRIGTHTTEFGTVAAWLTDVLNLITGNLDRPGGAMFPVALHQRAHRKATGFTSGRWSSRVKGLPEFIGEIPVATMADEIEIPGTGQIKALLTVAGNPVLTTPDSNRLDAALATLEFMVSVDPYLNATTRHADVILPPPSPLERPHYDLAFQTLSLRNYADWSPAVFQADGPSEFEILVKLTAIAAGLGAGADPDTLAEASLDQQIATAVGRDDSPIAGRDPADIKKMLGDRPVDERIVDFMIRTGHRGDGFGAVPEGMALAGLEAHPHGIDFGPLESGLPGSLMTASGKVEIGAAELIGDLPRLKATFASSRGDRMLLVGRRQVRTANSWTHNVEVLVKGKPACTVQLHPDDAARIGITEGDDVRLRSEVGAIELTVEITEDIMPGVVSVPYGWGHGAPGTSQSVAERYAGVNVNVLTDSGAIDPLSGNARLNGIPVEVEAAR